MENALTLSPSVLHLASAVAVAFKLGGVVLLVVLTAYVAAMATVSYWRSQDQDPGLTTEIVLILTARWAAFACKRRRQLRQLQ